MPLLILASMPTAAFAAPPATVASCEGIKDAYPILGTPCAGTYAKIHEERAGERAADRLEVFVARRTVMQIFRKALLCNGLFGASKSEQQSFKSKEGGHLTAIANLRTSMTANGDPDIPAAFTATELEASINKPQCK